MPATTFRRARNAALGFTAAASGLIHGATPADAALPECAANLHACYYNNSSVLVLTHQRAVERMSSFSVQANGVDNDNSRRECGYGNADYSNLEVSARPGEEKGFNDHRTIKSVKWSPDINNCPG